MGAVGYLYLRTLRNRIRMALRKPVTYFYLVLILFYMTAVPMSLRMTVDTLGADSAHGLVTVLTVFSFWTIPANLIAYARRKGLVYRNSDVHFLFPAPVSPKQVLLYAHFRTLAMLLVLNLFVIICGKVLFHAEGWRLAVYFVFSVFIENLLEASIMLLMYGSERLGEKQRGLVVKAAYGLTGILVVMGILAYLRGGLSLQTVTDYLHSDLVLLVPVIGWYVAVLHLLFLGATTVNVAGTICYILLVAVALAAAWRMKCTGDFYEDAIKYAEDYEAVLESRRQGNAQSRPGRKQKFGKARVNWNGSGARALFYRQLLEYKKSRYFIFDGGTVVAVLAGAAVAYLSVWEDGFGALENFAPFVIPAVSAYVIFIFTALNGKWAKELLSPYTYLIPDTVFRKLINATAMQHIQSLLNACLITLPGAIAMRLSPLVTALAILFYVVLSANKLYALAVAEAVCGSTLGRVGKQLLQMLIRGMAVMAAVIGGVLGMAVGGVVQAYVLMDVFLVLFTAIFMVIAMLNFYNMETA